MTDEDIIKDPEKYLQGIEETIHIFENSIIGKDKEVQDMIKTLRESNDVNTHMDLIIKLINKLAEKSGWLDYY